MMPQVLFKSRSNFTAPKRPTRATIACSLVAGILFLCVLVHLHFSALVPTSVQHQRQLSLQSQITSDGYQLVPPRRLHFSRYLFDQGISHDQFHVRVLKLRLAELVKKHLRVGVVGVAGGVDVIFFASAGYEVYAFDPMSTSMKSMTKWAKSAKIDHRIHAHQVAASDVTGGNITAAYLTGKNKQYEVAKRSRIDDIIMKPLDVLSLDIQGGEWDVLRGAMKIVKEQEVRSMWIEIHPCNKKVPPMLKKLDELGYAMFDMVPVGAPRSTMKRNSMFNVPGAARKGWFNRPSRFDQYFNWMCELSKNEWKWIQADLLVVRRDLLTPDVLLSIRNIGADVLLKYEVEGKLK